MAIDIRFIKPKLGSDPLKTCSFSEFPLCKALLAKRRTRNRLKASCSPGEFWAGRWRRKPSLLPLSPSQSVRIGCRCTALSSKFLHELGSQRDKIKSQHNVDVKWGRSVLLVLVWQPPDRRKTRVKSNCAYWTNSSSLQDSSLRGDQSQAFQQIWLL